MEKASEALFSLKPVSFRYKKEIDSIGTSQLGLVAEDVEKVNPDLVLRDKEGKPYMRPLRPGERDVAQRVPQRAPEAVQELKREIAALTRRMKEQDAKIQKVSDQLELNKAAPQMVSNR